MNCRIIPLFLLLLLPRLLRAQDSILPQANLEQCVAYALNHQPVIKQSLIDEEITDHQIKSKLADWYPQINFTGNYQHNFQLQYSAFNGSVVPIGTHNVSYGQFGATQSLFNRDVLLARSTAREVREQARQNTSYNKIDITVSVSKAFYNVLVTGQQIAIINEDIVRLQKSLKDAYSQYQAGLVDKIDYKRATINLNNSMAQKNSYIQTLKAQQVELKRLMGYPVAQPLPLVYDSLTMEREAIIDTNQQLNISNRIEYQQLQTTKNLQIANLNYTKWNFIPSLSAYGNYNLNYLNNNFADLYKNNLPQSYAGLSLVFPLFQSGKRLQNIKAAKLQVKRIDYDFENLHNSIYSEYTQAMANYKSYLEIYYTLKENLDLARDVYNTVDLQYRSGIKTYLEVVTAEADLITAQVNYNNSLSQLLSSKLDVQKALGNIKY